MDGPGRPGQPLANLRVLDGPDELARAGAAFVLERAVSAVALRGRCSLALSGGSTPLALYRLLSRPPLLRQMPWPDLHLFWGDERLLPPQDPRSNFGQALRAGLGQVPLPRTNLHPMPVELEPSAAAARYQAELESFLAGGPPALDLVLLGLGPDGHVASLFPQSPALAERLRWVAAVSPPATARPPVQRLTLTLPLLNQARAVLFLVSGGAKQEALAEVLRGGDQAAVLPAGQIQPAGDLWWLVDRAAAGGLELGGA